MKTVISIYAITISVIGMAIMLICSMLVLWVSLTKLNYWALEELLKLLPIDIRW